MSQYTVSVITGTGPLFLMMHADMVFVGASFSRQTAGTCTATLVHVRAGLLLVMAIPLLALSVPSTSNLE
jgi:molybdopterin biosynthesis enzyme MoaB